MLASESLSEYLRARGERNVLAILSDMEIRLDQLEHSNEILKEQVHYLTTKGHDE